MNKTNEHWIEVLKEKREKINKISPSFCSAKWLQTTLILQNGYNHSCHHPSPHKIPLDEIYINPAALHNSRYKKEQRAKMLRGERPKECDYCWKIEDLKEDHFSDRHYKTADSWSWDKVDLIAKSDPYDDIYPTYLEVSFSNACNFACAYCGPQYSSKWVEEIEKHGGYKTVDNYNEIEGLRAKGEMPYKQKDYNPYIEAFWEWWPDLFPDLHTFRITGGEPLLSKDTFKVLEYIRDNPEVNPNISLSINTNLGVPDKLMDKFIALAKDLCENNKVRELIVFTSIEAQGAQAEYTRHGLDAVKFWENVNKVLTELPKVTVNVMATFNALSVFTYGEVIDTIFELKQRYANKDRYWVTPIQLDTSYLRWPAHLSVKLLEDNHKELILESAKKALYYGMKEYHQDNYGFSNVEIQKIKRIYDYAIGKSMFSVDRFRKEFVTFVDQLDERRGTNFQETFPELKEFYAKHKRG